MNLPVVSYQLLYNGKDISADISNQVIGIEYDDRIKGESDELQITLEDSDRRWQNSWFPDKGATLQLIIRSAGKQMNCGTFQIDELQAQGSTSGDQFSIKALGAGITKAMRSKISYAHENKSLREIANTVAGNLGLTLQGNVEDISFERLHQYRETDLAFLNRIAGSYGYIFSVRGNLLVFTYYKDIEAKQPVITLGRNDLISFDIRTSTHLIYRNGRIRYHVPRKKKVIDYSTESESEFDSPSEDDMELYERIENDQQAQTRAAFGLHDNNSKMTAGDITIPGNILFLSGNNVQLQQIGKLSGVYHILDSRHSINRDGGYKTTGNLKKLQEISATLYK